MTQREKLLAVKGKFAHWNKGADLPNPRLKDGGDCSSAGEQCHGDGECGGDGD